jgi:RHS repeat-associated protein
MEAAYRATESKLFSNIASTSAAWTSMPNYQNIPNSIRYPSGVTVNDSVSKVDYNGTSGQTTGPGLLLKVMSGDAVSLGVQCYYVNNTLTTTNSSLNSVLNSLAGGIMGTPTGAAEGTLSGYTSSSGTVYSALSNFLGTNDPALPSGYPKAYLNWILLDDQFNYVSGSSGAVAAASTTYPANQMNTVAPGGPITMSKNGYLYVWVSNETQGWDVFFDNFSVQYRQGPVLEENHYYPFGLSMAGISDKALKSNYAENKYRFNFGSELQNKEFSDGSGLELYDAHHRMYDPQIGRFGQVDPLADGTPYYSPYSFGSNNPISHIDPFGMTDTVVTTKTTNLPYAYVYAKDPQTQSNNWLGWPGSTIRDRQYWKYHQQTYYNRVQYHQPSRQAGDPKAYTASVDMYDQWANAEDSYRAMQAWAVGVIAAPALLASSPAEIGLALRMKVGFNVGAFAVDASVQASTSAIEHKNFLSNYNFISGGSALLLGAPEGSSLSNVVGANLVNSTLSTSVNISASSVFGTEHILSFNPLSILINTAFGSGASGTSRVLGGGAVGDALAAPVNFTGAAIDEATKPKQ